MKVLRENNFEFRIVHPNFKESIFVFFLIYLHIYFGLLKPILYSFDTNSPKFLLNTTLSHNFKQFCLVKLITSPGMSTLFILGRLNPWYALIHNECFRSRVMAEQKPTTVRKRLFVLTLGRANIFSLQSLN